MSVTFGALRFVVYSYDVEDDILTLERLAGLAAHSWRTESREGDILTFDDQGTMVGLSILDARERFDVDGRLTETLPDGTELVSTDLGRLFEPATT